MATKYNLTTAFTAITETSGTIQNVGKEAVELASSTNAVAGEGVVLNPSEKRSFKGALSARSMGDAGAVVNVVDFTEAGEGGEEYDLPIASDTTLGGVKISNSFTVANDGTLNIKKSGKTILGGVKSSDDEGKVTVNNDGTMTYNPLGHTRETFTLANLISAVEDQNLDKYGIKVGDYYVGASGYTYIVAGLNPLKGTHEYTITNNHCGLIVCTHTTHPWNASGNTYTGADNRGAGYANSDLHYYLVNTVLPKVKGDLGESHLYAHQKLLSNAVNTTQYNRFGTNSGGASNWSWYSNQYISALTEHQVYGGIAWSSSGYDTGEADQQLEVFKEFKHTDIFGNEYVWLRDVASASYACNANGNGGGANNTTASNAYYVAALIAFH